MNKTVIITGGNAGIGFQCAKELAKSNQGWNIVLACRNKTSTEKTINEFKEGCKQEKLLFSMEFLKLDLNSLASVREFAAEFKSRSKSIPPLKALICNAGLQVISGITYTEDKVETTFGVNHLGHFLLTHLLLSEMKDGARIVFVSSGTHDPKEKTGFPEIILNSTEKIAFPDSNPKESNVTIGRRAYATSKLCNIFCTYELSRQLEAQGIKNITVNTYDPWMIPGTGLARDYTVVERFIWRHVMPHLTWMIKGSTTLKRSGACLARVVLDPSLEGVSGRYISLDKEKKSSDLSYDENKAKDLWDTSIKLCSLKQSETILKL